MDKIVKGSGGGAGPTTIEALKQLSRGTIKIDKSAALITFLNNNNLVQKGRNAAAKAETPYSNALNNSDGPSTRKARSKSRTKSARSASTSGPKEGSQQRSSSNNVGTQSSDGGPEIYVRSSRSRQSSQNNANGSSDESSTTSGSTSKKSANSSVSSPVEDRKSGELSNSNSAKLLGSSSKKSLKQSSSKSNNASSPATKESPAKTMGTGPTVITLPSKPLQQQAKVSSSKHGFRSSVGQGIKIATPTAGISQNYRALVEKAVREHKIFCIGGVYPAIRNALKRRGWVEKALNTNASQCMKTIIDSHLSRDVDLKPLEDESDTAYAQRVLANYPPDFVWVIRRDNVQWNSMARDQVINRFPKAFFTTKVGITACIQSMHWFSEPGLSDTFFPRCYRLMLEEEKQAFLDDFRLTACLGLLRWLCSNYEKDGERGVFDSSSRVSSLAVDFAVRQVNNYVRMRRHEDIDWLMPPAFMLQHWDVFLTQYYAVIHQKMKLGPRDVSENARSKYDIAKKALQRVAPYWPQLYVDGVANLWICKPGARSRGKGIIIMNQLDKILELLSQSNSRESNWVVQKYIERPLLVYKTKFDMRQWFIVTDWAPLTVWFAKESYIRFCTKPFSLEDFHESVHLCNNAVQCKYQNDVNRDSALPDENMWDCYTFQAYLKTIGKMDLWDKVIYPGMKQGIIGVLLASQESADIRKSCFELYGADFMLSEDFRPWLIEINSCPCMAASTSVTARMCAQCLEDCIKVVVDRKEDKHADTGMFELIYRQNPATLTTQQFVGSELLVTGKRLSKDVDWPGIMTKYNSKRGIPPARNVPRPLLNPSPIVDNGLTFMDLVHKLRLKDSASPINLATVSNSKSNNPSSSRRYFQTGTPISIPQITFPEPGLAPPRMKWNKESAPPAGNNILNIKKLQTPTGSPNPSSGYGRK